MVRNFMQSKSDEQNTTDDGTTICAKHIKIIELAQSILFVAPDKVEGVVNDIVNVAKAAKEDGIRMEYALFERKRQVSSVKELAQKLLAGLDGDMPIEDAIVIADRIVKLLNIDKQSKWQKKK
jgi:hypothetical protein